MAGSPKEDAVEEHKNCTEAVEKALTEAKHTIEIVKEQYAQYYQMLRQHNAFSWQIPSFVVIGLLFLLSLESKNLQQWKEHPVWPATGFLVMALFLVVMLIHHRRNLFYSKHYSRILAEIEKTWGVGFEVHHFQVEPKRNFLKRISSSLCLSIFLLLMIVGSLVGSIYYFRLYF